MDNKTHHGVDVVTIKQLQTPEQVQQWLALQLTRAIPAKVKAFASGGSVLPQKEMEDGAKQHAAVAMAQFGPDQTTGTPAFRGASWVLTSEMKNLLWQSATKQGDFYVLPSQPQCLALLHTGYGQVYDKHFKKKLSDFLFDTGRASQAANLARAALLDQYHATGLFPSSSQLVGGKKETKKSVSGSAVGGSSFGGSPVYEGRERKSGLSGLAGMSGVLLPSSLTQGGMMRVDSPIYGDGGESQLAVPRGGLGFLSGSEESFSFVGASPLHPPPSLQGHPFDAPTPRRREKKEQEKEEKKNGLGPGEDQVKYQAYMAGAEFSGDSGLQEFKELVAGPLLSHQTGSEAVLSLLPPPQTTNGILVVTESQLGAQFKTALSGWDKQHGAQLAQDAAYSSSEEDRDGGRSFMKEELQWTAASARKEVEKVVASLGMGQLKQDLKIEALVAELIKAHTRIGTLQLQLDKSSSSRMKQLEQQLSSSEKERSRLADENQQLKGLVHTWSAPQVLLKSSVLGFSAASAGFSGLSSSVGPSISEIEQNQQMKD